MHARGTTLLPAWLSHADPRPLTQVLRTFPRFTSRMQLQDTFTFFVCPLAPTAGSLKDAKRLLLLFLAFPIKNVLVIRQGRVCTRYHLTSRMALPYGPSTFNAGFTEIPSLRFENSTPRYVRRPCPSAHTDRRLSERRPPATPSLLRFFATLYAGSSKKATSDFRKFPDLPGAFASLTLMCTPCALRSTL